MTAEPENSEFHADIDLTGVKCPLNFAKIIVQLSKIETGQRLSAILDDGESIKNVPTSLDLEGHKVVSLDELSRGRYLIVIEKREKRR